MKPVQTYRSLIFDGALIPGVIAGTVGVTSRVINPQPQGSKTWLSAFTSKPDLFYPDSFDAYPKVLRCPFRVGEKRYIKEAWRPWGWRDDAPITIEYRNGSRRAETGADSPEYEDWYARIAETATLECARKSVPQDSEGCYRWQGDNPLAWRSPLFLPRYCARTWFEITGVKPARCREITEEEAEASGIKGLGEYRRNILLFQGWTKERLAKLTINQYKSLWDRLNARRGFPWDSNPWVWRCAFRLCETPTQGDV
jgi:hypothetical protein